jgi:hypothetical protein
LGSGDPAELLIQRLDRRADALWQFLDVHPERGNWGRVPQLRLNVFAA